MIVVTQNGVVSFYISNKDKDVFSPEFFSNKTYIFLDISMGLEVWGYNYTIPSLLIKNQVYFTKTATRDFYSNNKEEIFTELGLFERESGVYPYEGFQGSILKGAHSDTGITTWEGFLQLGDKVNGDIVKSFAIEYQFENRMSVGRYGI